MAYLRKIDELIIEIYACRWIMEKCNLKETVTHLYEESLKEYLHLKEVYPDYQRAFNDPLIVDLNGLDYVTALEVNRNVTQKLLGILYQDRKQELKDTLQQDLNERWSIKMKKRKEDVDKNM